MSILFKSLRFVAEGEVKEASDFLYDGKSVKKTTEEQLPDRFTTVDCTGFLGSRGWVDLRCLASEPGMEFRETIASLCEGLRVSGFTEAVLMPNTVPVVQSKNEVAYIQQKSQAMFPTLHVQAAVTKDTAGEDFTEMIDLSHYGVKIFGDGIHPLANSDRFMKALQYLQKFGGILFDHSYDPLLALFGQMHEGIVSTKLGMKGIPGLAEEMAIQKNLSILKYTGGTLHLQAISTAKSVDLIRKAKEEGLSVTADVSLYQLLFTDKDLVSFDTALKVLPPFREEVDRVALMEGLKDGTIDALVSNHIPLDFDAKHSEFDLAAFGMIGLQTFAPGLAMLEKELGWPLLIQKITDGPRGVLGRRSEEWDSLTIFDPEETWYFDQNNNVSLSANSPWFNRQLKGRVKFVINKGKFSQHL
ncbi:amidohydrolase family protein [Pleomorphovibrio marinus]|uniref:dihydroorotase n=1 Tax=Pleomorphovibrio marinus TaxID=2164132 RepID=UPI000E0C6D83|nr:dihydroorotase [Pleomorphovibrio marinus]